MGQIPNTICRAEGFGITLMSKDIAYHCFREACSLDCSEIDHLLVQEMSISN